MSRVRQRNSLVRLEHSDIKKVGQFNLVDPAGQTLKIEDIEGEYLLVFTGDLKQLIKLRQAMGTSLLFKELKYLYVSDNDRIQKLTKDVMRTPLPDT